ncbi:acyl-CoA synthetase (AMP-forming)/AMP-acid ligase II [Streptosporangium becharense]|uniref:Acyl-CoA synthetase (AMP-forming)/AMP-acid ligase II n=1 Tax=Streptosporangium becharense TaxID=1816182 RepID=A0A7W9IF08_9ACTN|nr:AMP-binding protein [Streptosporangium becharense]MBB2909516.1 acyl-CoA synthetase (AMP-forming)/AMP-acid ligase II [Streptosporangium becharense]MBB5819527.1 acyl-CoA synthetase (AMP-forming)/AMP-acid ligase II [Streptosporangium becharense]
MDLVHPHARLIDARSGRELAGRALAARVEAAAEELSALPGGLLLAPMPTEVRAVVRYLGALESGRPIALLDPAISREALLELVRRFVPAVVADPPGDSDPPAGYHRAGDPPRWVCSDAAPHHPGLGVLLTTSGSTGNPKLVRLARAAVLANARSVAESLGLTPGDVAPTSLPMHYTYGLSTLNSHLGCGAGVLVTPASVLDPAFWAAADAHRATLLSAVPYQFEMLHRTGFDPAAYPTLRAITQAGARLRTELVTDFAGRMRAAGGHLIKMYGMTEAPRISVLPPERLAEKPSSVGRAIPGGALSVAGDGEVVYEGPNVMMGYALSAADLTRGDDLGGRIRTGDLGHLDEEGFLYLDGRLKRIAKVFGVRVNLDDVERLLRGRGPVAAVTGDDRVVVWAEGVDTAACGELARDLAGRLNLHWSGFDVRGIDRLPLLGTGKVDYRLLEARV